MAEVRSHLPDNVHWILDSMGGVIGLISPQGISRYFATGSSANPGATGLATGDLSGSYPAPVVSAIHATSGTIDSVIIGSTTPANATVLTLSAVSLALTTPLAITQGGTGSTTILGIQSALGYGSIATQSAAAVALTGGSVDAVVIGGATPAAATVTTLVVNNSISVPAATTAAQAVNLGQFSSSLGTNGWRKLPDGTLEQWGVITLGSVGTSTTWTFPIPFPSTAPYSLSGIVDAASGLAATYISAAGAPTLTAAAFTSSATAGATAYVRALGKST